MQCWRLGTLVMATTVMVAAAARVAGAQTCIASRRALAPAALTGLRIRSVEVVTQPPPLGRLSPARLLPHTPTRPAVVERELLFAAGDTVDTLRIAQSMRQLRALGIFDDARVEGRRCVGARDGTRPDSTTAGDVALRVVTRDLMSVTPVVRVRGSSAAVGVDERNALGSGVALRGVVQSDGNRVGVAMAAHAPGLPWPGAAAELGAVQYANGNSWYAGVGPRGAWPTAPWIVDGRVAGSEQRPRNEPGTLFQRRSSSLLVGRRVHDPGGAASYLLAGGESDRADLSLLGGDAPVGPRLVHRDYVGLAAGAMRASTQFDTVSWLLPDSGSVADVPRGTEGELLIGAGRDRIGQQRAGHADLWLGHTLSRPGAGTIVAADLWASGFFGDDQLSASTVRSSLVMLRDAPHGLWTMRLAGERLMRPDPDVRALALLDPAAAAFPRPAGRLAEMAVAASAERAVHLRALTRSLGVDGALFAATSFRWDPTAAGRADDLGATVVGFGLRLAPWRRAGNTVRLDVGVPVLHTAGVRSRPYVALSIVPWPLSNRTRDGRRLP